MPVRFDAARIVSPNDMDGRNLFEPPLMQAAGFEYYSLGRGDATLHQKPFRERV